MILSCDGIVQEQFFDYVFDSACINNFSIKNDDGPVTIVPGQTYLFPTYSAYGHSLMDVYAQFKILQLKYKDIKPFFYEAGMHGHYFNNNRVTIDQMENLGYAGSKISNLAVGNYEFEKVIMFFDMNNTFPESFYQSNGANRSSNYFPFCDCYMGTEKCGESKYFKYNYLAIDILKDDFKHLFSNQKTEKLFVSRERYNKKYQEEIEFYSKKESLTDEERNRYIWAKARSTPKEVYIQELFKSNGYTVIHAQDYSLFQQIQLFSSAKEIASISGTALFNTFWCDYQTKVFEVLAVPGYHYHYKEFADYAGVNHSYIDVVDLSEEETLSLLQENINKINEKGV